MPTSCSAYGCTNRRLKNSYIDAHISFHRFPLDDKHLLKLWLLNIRRANFVPTHSSKICSDHFEEKCFKYQPYTGRRELKKNAVPTKFCFSSSDKIEQNPVLKVDLFERFPLESNCLPDKIEQNPALEVDLFKRPDRDDCNCSDCGLEQHYRKKKTLINLQEMVLPHYDVKKGLWLKSITPLKSLQKEPAFMLSKYEAENETSKTKQTSDSDIQLNNQGNEQEILERATQEETEVWPSFVKEEMIDFEIKLDQQTPTNTEQRKTDEINLTSDNNSEKLKYFIFPSSSNSSMSNSLDRNCVSHGDALKAAETLLRYMESREDVDKSDLILIGSYQKKILENIKKESM